MNKSTKLLGGSFELAEDFVIGRMGCGAMQLAGPHVFGPPADRAVAVAVLREAVALGLIDGANGMIRAEYEKRLLEWDNISTWASKRTARETASHVGFRASRWHE